MIGINSSQVTPVQIAIPTGTSLVGNAVNTANAVTMTPIRGPVPVRKVVVSPAPRVVTLVPGSVLMRPAPGQAIYQNQPPQLSAPAAIAAPVGMARSSAVNPCSLTHFARAMPPQRQTLATRNAGGLGQDSGNNSADLIELLAERLDLLSQIQLNRAAADERAKLAQAAPTEEADYTSVEHELAAPSQPPAQYLQDGNQDCARDGFFHGDGCNESSSSLHGVGYDMPSPTTTVSIDRLCAANPANNQLWDMLGQKEACISRLTGEVEALRSHLVAMGAASLATTSTTAGDTPLQSACWAPADVVHSENLQVGTDHSPMGNQYQCFSAEAIPDADMMSATRPVPRVDANDVSVRGALADPPRSHQQHPRGIGPWSRAACGVNLEISEDGFTASRTRGCRQAVVVSTTPLESQSFGRYFEVEVQETVDGWVGGLGIGVTTTPPENVRRVPDKAWGMPGTFIAGYWGCVFSEEEEGQTSWQPDALNAGSKVGLLLPAGCIGEVMIFVDGNLVVHYENINVACHETLFPIVDVFAATRVVRLMHEAASPTQPRRPQDDGASGSDRVSHYSEPQSSLEGQSGGRGRFSLR